MLTLWRVIMQVPDPLLPAKRRGPPCIAAELNAARVSGVVPAPVALPSAAGPAALAAPSSLLEAGEPGADWQFAGLPRLPLAREDLQAEGTHTRPGGFGGVADPGPRPGQDPGSAVRGLAVVDWLLVAGGPPVRSVLWYDRAGWLHLLPLSS